MAAVQVLRWNLYFALFLLSSIDCGSGVKPERHVRRPEELEIVTAADACLTHLRKLSESGIYEEIYLDSILEAASNQGVYHDNIFLKLRLRSAYFKSGNLTEVFNFMHMRHLEDGALNFAIDEFPEMDEDAIEEFWIQMVERKRARRDEVFQRFLEEFENEATSPT